MRGTTPSVDYRGIAHQIVSEDRFHPPPLPRPLHGALDALGRAAAPVADAVDDAFSTLAAVLPGGGITAAVLLGSVVATLAAVASARMTDRALLDRARPSGRLIGGPAGPDARTLEAAAVTAERDGDFAHAIRLRFQAGLLRLDELGVLAYRPSLANAAVSRRLDSPIFDALARRFEEVTYGGRHAGPADAGQARDAWQRVLRDATRR